MLIRLSVLLLSAVVGETLAQNRWCGPFDLITTTGALYTIADGYQFPGSSAYDWSETAFYISDEGTLVNDAFEPCTFTNALRCSPDFVGDKSWAIAPPYGEVSWRGDINFWICPRFAVKYPGLPTKTTMVATGWDPGHLTKEPVFTREVTYIEAGSSKDHLITGDYDDKVCWKNFLQAPRCKNADEFVIDRPTPRPASSIAVGSGVSITGFATPTVVSEVEEQFVIAVGL